MKLANIVAGTDFSPTSKPAIDQAVALAAHHHAKLIVVHGTGLATTARLLDDDGAAADSTWQAFVRKQMQRAEQQLAEVAEQCRKTGVEVTMRLSDDYGDTALIATARDVWADLVVVGTHARRGTDRWLLGSVAESTMRQVPCHLLVARPSTPARGSFDRILCPTDFSDIAATGLAAALELGSNEASIELLHCWQPPLFGGYAPPDYLINRLRDEARAEGERLCVERDAGNKRLRFQLVDATPIEGILHRIDPGDRQIVVMGSHGRRGVRRWIMGSVAESVVRRSPLSVLVTHSVAS